MKKNTLFLLMLMALTTFCGKSQTYEFTPVGAEWYYTRYYREDVPVPSGIACDRFTSLRTVDVDGIVCKEIELYQHIDCYGSINPYTELRYIHQDGDLIYEVEDGELYLLYDFSKEPGEYWISTKYDVTVFVTNVSYITLDDGSTRRVLETTSSDSYCWFGNIIEGIGREESLFPQYQLDGAPCLEGPIRCYFESGIQLISSETDCDYEMLTVDENDASSSVFINTLVDNMLHITFDNNWTETKTIQIFDMTGKMVYETHTSSNSLEVAFDNRPAGVYFLNLTDDKGKMSVKKVVKE